MIARVLSMGLMGIDGYPVTVEVEMTGWMSSVI
jgi:hypothetical protein